MNKFSGFACCVSCSSEYEMARRPRKKQEYMEMRGVLFLRREGAEERRRRKCKEQTLGPEV